MTLTWTQPEHEGMANFAMWNGTIFAYVTGTARADRKWRVAVFPSGYDDGTAMGALVISLEQGKKYVERWTAQNHERIVVKQRILLPHEGVVKPRKPKGSDERS